MRLAKNGALNRRARRAQACVILRVRVRNKSFYVFAKKSLARGIFSAIVGAITINQRNIYMTPVTELETAEIDALIYHYGRIRERIAGNVTAMERLLSLQIERDKRVAILNDETR